MNVNILNDMKEQNKISPYVYSHILAKFQAKKQSIVNSVEMYEALQSKLKSLSNQAAFFCWSDRQINMTSLNIYKIYEIFWPHAKLQIIQIPTVITGLRP